MSRPMPPGERTGMRVLYLTDSLSDLDGVGRYAVRLLTALQQIEPKLEVQVLLARKHRPTSSDTPPHWKVDVALPPDYFYYMAPSRFWPSLAAGTWRTWRAARRCDLVHAIKDHPHSLVAVLGARLAGVPCISTAHGTYSVLPLRDGRHTKLARWPWLWSLSTCPWRSIAAREVLVIVICSGAFGCTLSRTAPASGSTHETTHGYIEEARRSPCGSKR